MTKYPRFPTDTVIRTPTGRLARVEYYDKEGRVHVVYAEGDEGLFPGSLLNLGNEVKADDHPETLAEKRGRFRPGHKPESDEAFWAKPRMVEMKYGR